MVGSHARLPRLGFRSHRPETRSGKREKRKAERRVTGLRGWRRWRAVSGSEWYGTMYGWIAGSARLEPFFERAVAFRALFFERGGSASS